MRKKTALPLPVILTVCLLAGCSSSGSVLSSEEAALEMTETADTDDSADTKTGKADVSQTDEDMFTDRDLDSDYEESECVSIQLEGNSAQASSDSVQISGSTITITEEAVYLISGTLDDGMIIVDADDSAKIQLVLNGAEITSETSAPIYILEADKVFVTLADNSENTLSNGGSYTAIDDSNIDAVIYSKQDLTLNGSGALAISSPAGHGIVSNDDLVITSGTYTITSSSHGLKANDSIRLTGDTSITLSAGKDGFHAENDEDTSLGFIYISGGTVTVDAQGDGISAGAYAQITDGTFDILAGGGSENGTKESSDSWGEFRGAPGGGGPGGSDRGSRPSGGERDEGGGRSKNMEPPSLPEESQNNAATSPVSAQSVIKTSAETSQNTETAEDDSSTSMKGIKAGGSMLISGGTFTIDSADDSVHSNGSITLEGGTFEIASGDDAFHADETLTVTEASINVAESYEGLEALHLNLQGGEITLIASDDGLNAAGGTDSSGAAGGRDAMFDGRENMASSNGSITISGGTIQIQASGDGIDANGSLEITGGSVIITGPTQGDTSILDYDTTGVISGGTFIGTGSLAMAQSFSDSKQGVIASTLDEQSAQTEITLTDPEGNILFDYTPELSFNMVILSSPDLTAGETYTLATGSVTENVTAN